MKKILVAVDLSDLATSAIDQAVLIALAFQSHVHILHVEVPTPSYIGNEIGPQVIPGESEEEHGRINSDVASMASYMQQRGVEADYELARGPVIETIVEKAIAYKANLIVMGAHNHGFLYQAFIGSVSSGVVKRSPCPVMIIPGK
jgi:nucleotide-binding universal stress UspA family protein